MVTVAGPDRPGITATLVGILAKGSALLVDIEQVVVQGQLSLCLLLEADAGNAASEALLKDLLFAARDLRLHLDFQVLDAPPPSGSARAERARYALTAIGDPLVASAVQVIAAVLAQHGANIDAIRRLSQDNLSSLEFLLSLPASEALGKDQMQTLRQDLMRRVADQGIDIALQKENLLRRAKRLVVMDMDSTLVRVEVIDELARLAGVYDEVAAITRQAMLGNLSFEDSLRARVAQLAGLDYGAVQRLAADVPLNEGAEDLVRVLRGLGYKTAVLSGGFTVATDVVKMRLGLDYAHANELEVLHGKLTGKVREPILGPQRKADLFDTIAQRENIPLEQTIAIGDGANDLLMLQKAGLGIAFHAKPKLKAAADTSVSAGGLDRILYLLGLSTQEVKEFLNDAC